MRDGEAKVSARARLSESCLDVDVDGCALADDERKIVENDDDVAFWSMTPL